ncbi:MAG TPA: Gfo/Idh/MocA family oxidoreductase, partial [Pirellulaceae bacterium]
MGMASNTQSDRRQFLQAAGAALSAGALVHNAFPQGVHPGGNEVLRLGLVGAGGRGMGAVVDALTADPETRLVAIADTFLDRARDAREMLTRQTEIAARIQVPDDALFSDFDGYRRAIDAGIDVVILATPPHFRPDHLEYAVKAGKHCFVEKPVAVDAPGYHRVRKICEEARRSKLAVVSGLCYRYDDAVVETIRRIQDGAIGEILAIESHYNAGTLWHRGDQPTWSRMEYQIRNWLYYTWLSGDHIVEQAVHSLDKTAWLLDDASPVSASGMGGRQQRVQPEFGHIYDHHTVFYEYPQGVRVFFTCRQMDGCENYVDEVVIGTRGKARILAHRIEPRDGSAWEYDGPPVNMYGAEHVALFRSIRQGTPLDNGTYMANSTMIALMGRMASYSGQKVTWEQCLANPERLGPTNYAWTDLPEPP